MKKLASFSRIASVVVTLVASLLAVAYNTPKGQNFINGFLGSGLQNIPGSGDNNIALVKEVHLHFGRGANEENGGKTEKKQNNESVTAQSEIKTVKAAEQKANPKPAEKPAIKTVSTSQSKLLSSDPGNDLPDNDGRTALLRHSRGGRLDYVKEKIEEGSNVNYARPYNQFTALMYAAEGGYADIAKLLIDSGADVNSISNDKANGTSALLEAAKKNNLKIIKLLLDAGADVNHIGNDGKSALTLATARNDINVDIVKALLDAGADPNHADRKKNTPLHHASWFGSQEGAAAQVLLAKGANPNVLNEDKWSPIGLAVENRKKKTLDTLLDEKLDLNTNDIPILELALTHYDDNDASYWNSAIKRLIESGADVNAIVTRGRGCTWEKSTVLMSAVACGRVNVARLLIEGGADVDAAAQSGTFKGFRPLSIAIERKGHLDRSTNEVAAKQIAEMLKAAGAHL